MPPKGKPRPPEKEVQALSDWIGGRAEAATHAKRAAGRVVLRRLNRVEYENTVRDLLGVDVDLKELLPEDTSAHGFDNGGEALHISSFLMERYLEAADTALNVAIANGPQPPLIKKRYSLKDERAVKTTTESVYRKRDDALVMFSSSAWNAITVGQFYPPDRGRYRFRISASGFQSGQAGHLPRRRRPDADGDEEPPGRLLRCRRRQADRRRVRRSLEAREHIRILPYGLATAQRAEQDRGGEVQGPGLAVQWVEVEGRCTTPGRRRATAGSSATCRRPRPGPGQPQPRWRSSRRTPTPTPSASSATSPAAPSAGP